MKTGRTLTELAMELDRQNNEKKDYVLDTRAAIAMPHVIGQDGEIKNDGICIGLNGYGSFPVNRIANAQIGSRLDIPKKYYDKMLINSPELLCTNINHWFNNEPEKRLVRTLDGNARAFLSDRYRPLDNYDLAEAVLPSLIDSGAEVRSCEVTESKMYIKAICNEIEGEVKVGDAVRGGVIVSNSEVGHGSLFVGPFIERLVCTNGMVVSDFGKRRYHVGKRNNDVLDYNDAYELYTDKTKELTDQAFWHQVRDVVKSTLSQQGFNKIIESLREASEVMIEADPLTVVEKTQKKFSLNDTEKGSVLQHLLRDGDLSKYGLANAVTRTAEDSSDYDRATELETLGWSIVQLPQRDWSAIAIAA